MTERKTEFGTLIIAEKEILFAKAVSIAEEGLRKKPSKTFSWALTGGSTPTEFYKWCVVQNALSPALVSGAQFYVSDERVVPLESEESNFGNADRELLTPLGVKIENKHAWPIGNSLSETVVAFGGATRRNLGAGKGFDLCFLGLGSDAHTASFFPGEVAWQADFGDQLFVALETKRGARLTITPTGLRSCSEIVVMALGSSKAEALKRVIDGGESALDVPAKILKASADHVTWLLDPAAANLLKTV